MDSNMSDEKKEEISVPKHASQIKVLFDKLTEMILASVITKADGINLLVMVLQWAALIIASILVMLESDPRKIQIVFERFMDTFAKDVGQNVKMIQTLQRNAKGEEEKRIIVP